MYKADKKNIYNELRSLLDKYMEMGKKIRVIYSRVATPPYKFTLQQKHHVGTIFVKIQTTTNRALRWALSTHRPPRKFEGTHDPPLLC